MKKIICGAAMAVLAGCQSTPPRDTYDAIAREMRNAAKPGAAASAPDAVEAALLPPLPALASQLPKARPVLDERFNVSFAKPVPAQLFFNALVEKTRYNMLIDPKVTGDIAISLKDVTLPEALDAVRELYGYDYKIEGSHIYIRPLTMQTRMFKVNYLTATRKGSSNVRVSSTSVGTAGVQSSGGSGSQGGQQPANNQPAQAQQATQVDSSNVTTELESNFWTDLKSALEALVGGSGDGRSVVISPQSGVIVVRAMPDQLRSIDQYLKATRLAVERQVILEAKILEVQLNSGFQTGINWASFASFKTGHDNRVSGGFLSPGTSLAPLPFAGGQPPTMTSGGAAGIAASTGFNIANAASNAGSLFGLAFQTSNFAAMISFLESQGSVHVLSSPRITAVNNQKAVLKIGTDEFYVTGVSTTTSNNTTGSTTSPNVTLQPFFSGVVLDVTPQIDDEGGIMLHVHPSVSQVTTVNKTVNLGSAGSLNLPLPASSTSEMDSMVRGQDGQIVAIGGLMRQSSTADDSQLPGADKLPLVGNLFRNTDQRTQKRELVVLIKPTIVDGPASWNQETDEAVRRIEQLDPRRKNQSK